LPLGKLLDKTAIAVLSQMDLEAIKSELDQKGYYLAFPDIPDDISNQIEGLGGFVFHTYIGII